MTSAPNFAFPVGSLTPLSEDEPPSSATLQVLQTELNSNAMSVPSTTSTGFGHLVLTAQPQDYVTFDTTDFPAPLNPGLNPVHSRGATAEELTESNRQHRLLCEDFNLYWTLEWALKTLLVLKK